MGNSFENAGAREKEFHPTRLSDGKPISAWTDRAKALTSMANRLTAAEQKIAELEAKVGDGDPFA